ncbi:MULTISPECIES: tol-pal system-associated acyl-CoA thioesterase [Bordetella]|uniref:Tol-pal system-associated acyl-CoA thioesterase n=2 Tax=Bordetella TaxID=517 RepID=A0A261VZA6_9BORD|nr:MULTISPECIES: tol-pal system-associated acyl-CoA thioesterase [Bordetella]MDM9560377.1 tol-pal system-associated acyl-CoA thioesterase [Bordetella petrii]OZI78950.1 tol-pal system-associated acyl-CoA thioesterase [Bordetella genomosp. 2]
MIEPKSAESTLPIRVYYEDTDAGGVVFYANYLKYMERARTEWLRELGVEQSALVAGEGRLFVVHSLDMSYRKPARLDDLLIIRSRVTRVGRASIDFAQRAERDGELLAQGNIQVCCVDAVHMRPAALPAVVRTKLESLQE